TCSIGRPVIWLDNAVAENPFATLKVERIHRRPWPPRSGIVQAIFASVETWYDPHHRHGSLG
ncbi:MAG: IS3 family transposase, partial [Chloroflexi bacterium]|nr:IS3 family transposase [Chloroflexota bacterium]